MKYPTIGREEAEAGLAAIRNGRRLPVVEVLLKGKGPEFDRELADHLIDGLLSVRKDLGEPEAGPRRYWGIFEGRAAEVVHQTLALSPAAAADPGFWYWLLFGRDDDWYIGFVDWRHGKADQPGGAHDSNYGVGSNLAEGLLSRLWFRAEVSLDPEAPGRYDLCRRGDQDFWRSHVLRQEYAHVRQVTRALVRFQFPDDDPTTPTANTRVIREIAKELRRRQATLAFELMTEQESLNLIRQLEKGTPDL